jgi:hypothetical protein
VAKKNSKPELEVLDLPTTGKLTFDQLERYLWSTADILRGSIDSSDYKCFIFGLLRPAPLLTEYSRAGVGAAMFAITCLDAIDHGLVDGPTYTNTRTALSAR